MKTRTLEQYDKEKKHIHKESKRLILELVRLDINKEEHTLLYHDIHALVALIQRQQCTTRCWFCGATKRQLFTPEEIAELSNWPVLETEVTWCKKCLEEELETVERIRSKQYYRTREGYSL